MNNPPTIDMWLLAPQLASVVVNALWPYMVLPLDFILGLTLLKAIFSTIRSLTHQSTGGGAEA
jgi:hypothetical protein